MLDDTMQGGCCVKSLIIIVLFFYRYIGQIFQNHTTEHIQFCQLEGKYLACDSLGWLQQLIVKYVTS